MRTLDKVVLSFGLAACTHCAPANRGGDDDSAVTPIDARPPPPPIDAPAEIDARDFTSIPPDCLDAAGRGLAWLVPHQQADGHYGDVSPVATTAFAVLKLETYARELGQSPFEQAFVYHNQVFAGLDYLFMQAHTVPITAQQHGNPDADGNGTGVSFGSLGNFDEVYEHSVATMAIAGGGEPDRLVTAAGSPVVGLTYRAVVQDAVDYLAMAQSDATSSSPQSCTRGGWRYTPYDHMSAVGDNSVTQWAVLALEYAHHPLYHYEIAIPDWLSLEVREWVTCMQNHSTGAEDGGSGYTGPIGDVDAYKTGALIQQASFLGDTAVTPNMVAAQAFLQRVWTNTTGVGWKLIPTSDYLTMYSVMKGMESMAIDQLGPIDWYREFCDQLKAEQQADGSWRPSQWDRERVGASGMLSTEWALLVLEKAAPPPEIIP